MTASNNLKKQIITEIVAIFILLLSIGYAYFKVDKKFSDNAKSQDGMIVVLDNKINSLDSLSDGQASQMQGMKYTVTNNNDDERHYKLILKTNAKNELLKNVRISVDDLFADGLTNLTKDNNGYVISDYTLNSGYTKIHKIKIWYDKDYNGSEDFNYDLKLNVIG